jgi:choline-sulfatase
MIRRHSAQTVCMLGALALLGVLAAQWRSGPPRLNNVLLVTLDTTRADHLTAYGFHRITTPWLDRLAATGVVFDEASTVAPLTLPAHVSLFTGLLPPHHGVRDNGAGPLDASLVTLAQVLRGHGFATAAFTGSVVLRSDRGLVRGFDEYHDVRSPADRLRVLQRRGNEVVDEAIAWLGRSGPPFFAWVHLYDAHAPYDPPEPYRTIYAHDLYSGEIAFDDVQIGRLVRELETRGLFNDTLIVVAGDHGESLGDHGERTHGLFVYQSVLHVPLIMHGAGLPPGRLGGIMRLTDVMPTILDLVGIAPPRVDGVSLAEVVRGKRSMPELTAYAESMYPARFGWSPLAALRAGRYKLIQAPRPELYDLASDPGEQRNLYDSRSPQATALLEELRSLAGSPPPGRSGADASPALASGLAALGYLGNTGVGSRNQGAEAPDPKDRVELYNLMTRPRDESRDLLRRR